jgi:hypothetical protein
VRYGKFISNARGNLRTIEFVDIEVDRAHISLYNLVYFKEQLGYGARDFYRYSHPKCRTSFLAGTCLEFKIYNQP